MRADPLATVQRILRAQSDSYAWSTRTSTAVLAAQPEALSCTPTEWRVTVEAFRTELETPEDAAQRLALYLVLHREAYGEAPRLESIRNGAMPQ